MRKSSLQPSDKAQLNELSFDDAFKKSITKAGLIPRKIRHEKLQKITTHSDRNSIRGRMDTEPIPQVKEEEDDGPLDLTIHNQSQVQAHKDSVDTIHQPSELEIIRNRIKEIEKLQATHSIFFPMSCVKMTKAQPPTEVNGFRGAYGRQPGKMKGFSPDMAHVGKKGSSNQRDGGTGYGDIFPKLFPSQKGVRQAPPNDDSKFWNNTFSLSSAIQMNDSSFLASKFIL
jgi:hypothetical protein